MYSAEPERYQVFFPHGKRVETKQTMSFSENIGPFCIKNKLDSILISQSNF